MWFLMRPQQDFLLGFSCLSYNKKMSNVDSKIIEQKKIFRAEIGPHVYRGNVRLKK